MIRAILGLGSVIGLLIAVPADAQMYGRHHQSEYRGGHHYGRDGRHHGWERRRHMQRRGDWNDRSHHRHHRHDWRRGR